MGAQGIIDMPSALDHLSTDVPRIDNGHSVAKDKHARRRVGLLGQISGLDNDTHLILGHGVPQKNASLEDTS